MDCKPIPKDLESEALSAEAWNHLAEYAPRLVRAAAEGLGVSLGAIRHMAAEGRITSAVLAGAFQKKAQDQQQEDRDRMAKIAAKAKAYGFSHDDVLRALDAAAMPKFAVGDMLAKVHTGEAIVPAKFDHWPEALALGREIVRLNTQMAQLLARWDGDGVPAVRGH